MKGVLAERQETHRNIKQARVLYTETAGDAEERIHAEEELEYTHEEASCNFTESKLRPSLCVLCSKEHPRAECPGFNNMNLNERYVLTREKRLCRACLGGGHVSKFCRRARGCNTCGENHHTLFHDNNFKPRERRWNMPQDSGTTQKESAVVNLTKTLTDTDSTLIVPVYVHSDKSFGSPLKTYAVIDTQANCSFMTDDLSNQLQLTGIDTTLELRTMAGVEVSEVKKIRDIFISDIQMCNKIKVPKLYTMTEIAADHTQIPDLTLVKQWPHLKDVAKEMEPVDWKVPIGILLGRNCLSAMKPRDCITGNSEEPYAVRMDVGWGVVGNLKRNELKTKECSWSLRTEAKEVTPLYVAKMFEMEFQESISQKTMSVQDRKFIKCMEEGYQRDQNGRVTLPLPFKEEPVLPDNRQQVLSLTYKLRTKLKKDPAYHQQYKEFMTKLLQRGHAE